MVSNAAEYLKIVPIVLPSFNMYDYRNTPIAVKNGFGPSIPRNFACKDFVAMLIEYVLKRFSGSN
jgi:hypothetical protein